MTVGKKMLYSGEYEKRYSARGQLFYVWKKPMPRINDALLDSVVYLYPSVEDANAGKAAGGTGFLITIPSEAHEGWDFTYCVTNSHVIREGSSPVIRLNTKDGGKDVIGLRQEDWVHHEDGDDIATCPLNLADPGYYRYTRIHTEMFVTKELIQQQNMGPGDEVFMIGRFVNHEGRQRNTPAVRFGNISMMPWEEIKHPRGFTVESFLVETRSLGGFSGSPVFVYHTPYSPLPASYPEREQGTWLLGVDWGHLPITEKVRKSDKTLVDENWVVESNSGQMAVAPAWKLQELIDQEDLAMGRRRADEELTKRKEGSTVVLDMLPEAAEQSTSPAQAPDAFTEEAFEDALDRVSRREQPSDPRS